MGKSYAQKVKAKQDRTITKKRSIDRSPKDGSDRKNKFPLAPVVVLGIVVLLIVATIVMYQVQNNDGEDGYPNGGVNGDDPPSGLPTYSRISLESLDGGIISLDQYHGKVVLIDMFATWCGPCADQMEELMKLQDRFSRDELVILSVDTDPQETKGDVRIFMSDYPEAEWTFAMSNPDFNNNFRASSIPTLFILDKDLEVAETEVGVTSVSVLQEKVQNLL